MPDSALTPQAAIDSLGAMSGDLRAACLLDERGELVAHTGEAGAAGGELCGLTGELFHAADDAGARAGIEPVARVEVSRPDGAVFALRDQDRSGTRWTLLVVTAGGALSSLVLYDMRMTVRSIGPDATNGGAGKR